MSSGPEFILVLEERETAIRVMAFRQGFAAGLRASVVAGEAALQPDSVYQTLQLQRCHRPAAKAKLLHVAISHAHRLFGNLGRLLSGRVDVRQSEKLQRFDPILQRNDHLKSPSAALQADPAANEEERIAALVFAHRLSEVSE